ncbi:MAG: hypothetical protein KBC64_01815 [Simkaniaceae bacterium]|nr:hypothetical protein [Simkaniaceae bacterium]
MGPTIALFGEAEKGDFSSLHQISSVPQLSDHLGNPPEDSLAILLAVQALMFDHSLVFIRVREEGFSLADYMRGLKLLETQGTALSIQALCLPGVGNPEIIHASRSLCKLHQSLLIISEQDLYDYLTDIQ